MRGAQGQASGTVLLRKPTASAGRDAARDLQAGEVGGARRRSMGVLVEEEPAVGAPP
jgi:hypothetical protein